MKNQACLLDSTVSLAFKISLPNKKRGKRKFSVIIIPIISSYNDIQTRSQNLIFYFIINYNTEKK